MSIDREATLKKAEKVLRQGKLSGAINEYRDVRDRIDRLVQSQQGSPKA